MIFPVFWYLHLQLNIPSQKFIHKIVFNPAGATRILQARLQCLTTFAKMSRSLKLFMTSTAASMSFVIRSCGTSTPNRSAPRCMSEYLHPRGLLPGLPSEGPSCLCLLHLLTCLLFVSSLGDVCSQPLPCISPSLLRVFNY